MTSTDLNLTVSPTSLLESADPPASDAPDGTEDPTLVTVTAELDDGALAMDTTVTLTLGTTGAIKDTDYTTPICQLRGDHHPGRRAHQTWSTRSRSTPSRTTSTRTTARRSPSTER